MLADARSDRAASLRRLEATASMMPQRANIINPKESNPRGPAMHADRVDQRDCPMFAVCRERASDPLSRTKIFVGRLIFCRPTTTMVRTTCPPGAYPR